MNQEMTIKTIKYYIIKWNIMTKREGIVILSLIYTVIRYAINISTMKIRHQGNGGSKILITVFPSFNVWYLTCSFRR